ncbi:hypothetical protein BKA69DRAFT_1164842 [Paraphysoderma sedebokerense]|nr:hypothetical protein BKA69DRAFT_1164842 [Paraphysoderma sedebokerense]
MSLADLLSLPFRLAVSILVGTYNFAATLLPFLPRIQPQNVLGYSINRTSPPRSLASPQTLAARFTREFEETYGSVHPDFFQNGYNQALEQMKQDLRFLVVYLHSEEHDNTDDFCRKTLSSAQFVDFVRQQNILFWAGNVKEGDAFQVGITLGATTFPFLAVVALVNPPSGGTKPAVVARIEGPTSTEDLVARIKAAMDRHELLMATVRAERAERDSARILREQQDQAYQESLRKDQERERKQREERERQRREEEEKEKAFKIKKDRLDVCIFVIVSSVLCSPDSIMFTNSGSQARKSRRQRLLASLPAEPEAGTPNTTRIQFRLPDGSRHQRCFNTTDAVKLLYNYIESFDPLSYDTLDASSPDLELPGSIYNDEEFEFILVSPFPREEYTDMNKTVKEAGLVNGNLMVEEK